MYVFVGPSVKYIGETKLPNSHLPLLLNQGELISESPNGKISHLLLSTHQVSASLVKKDQKQSLEQNLNQYLELLRYS